MGVGVIMLAGVVVSIAILLVNYTNILRRSGNMTLRDAVKALDARHCVRSS